MLRIRVNIASAEIVETEKITAGRVGLRCGFTFDSAWDGLAKTAVVSGVVRRDRVLVGDEIEVPGECLIKENFLLRIGVVGKNGDGTVVIPTVWANFGKILPSAEESGETPAEPTPDVVAQIQQNSANALLLAQRVMQMAEDGEFNGKPGAPGADGSGVWYTTGRVSGDDNPFVRRRDLIGREGAAVQVHDLLFAPDVGDEGEPTTLYEITSVGVACALNRLCKMKGEGGSGTGDYNDLDNKPQIAGVTLSGDKSLSDLGVAPKPMLVTLSYTGSGDTYTADKTYAEITDAIAVGREVLADCGASILRPSALGATWIGYDDSQILEFILHSDSSWTGIITDLGSYRTAADQDTIDRQQNAAIEAKYAKPAGGIPASDLAEDVQTSLTKANTALQQHQDISGKADKPTEVTVSTAGDVTQALDAGKIYHFTGSLTALTLTLNSPAAGQQAQYHFDFDCGSTAPTVTIPNSVTMPSGNFEASKHYEVDILNNYGMVMAWATS